MTTFHLQLFMKRNSTYIAFVFAGALIGERVSCCCSLELMLLCQALHGCRICRVAGMLCILHSPSMHALFACRSSTQHLIRCGRQTTEG